MASSLSNLVNNPSEGIHKIKCKYEHDEKKNVKLVELHMKRRLRGHKKSLLRS